MEDPTLSELKAKLAEEEEVYADFLGRLDELADNPPPLVRDPQLKELLAGLNTAEALGPPSEPARGSGMRAWVRRFVRPFVEPELVALRRSLEHQRLFNSELVQLVNRLADADNQRAARASEFASALVGFAQRIDRLVDAKDRLYATLSNTRTDLLLEAMDKRLTGLSLGVQWARERMEGTLTNAAIAREELAALKGRIAALTELPSEPSRAPCEPVAPSAFEPAHYVAFEQRFRGSSEELTERLVSYLPYFEKREPVVDLGCGRGEFLALLDQAGIEARGVDDNHEMVQASRTRGLSVEEADLMIYVRELDSGSTGGLFAAQVIEHLPPPRIRELLAECHRVLRPDGRLVLETVNPRSVSAFIESFLRDLTHEKPLHPETLEFLLRASGFRDVTIVYANPVSERGRLLGVTAEDSNADTLNRNFEKLNAFLYGEQDYAAVATR